MMSALYVEVVVKIQGRKSLREGREGKETGKGMWIESRFGGIDSFRDKIKYIFVYIDIEFRMKNSDSDYKAEDEGTSIARKDQRATQLPEKSSTRKFPSP